MVWRFASDTSGNWRVTTITKMQFHVQLRFEQHWMVWSLLFAQAIDLFDWCGTFAILGSHTSIGAFTTHRVRIHIPHSHTPNMVSNLFPTNLRGFSRVRYGVDVEHNVYHSHSLYHARRKVNEHSNVCLFFVWFFLSLFLLYGVRIVRRGE